MSYGLNLGWGGPIGDYIGFWWGPIKGIYHKFSLGSYQGVMSGLYGGCM